MSITKRADSGPGTQRGAHRGSISLLGSVLRSCEGIVLGGWWAQVCAGHCDRGIVDASVCRAHVGGDGGHRCVQVPVQVQQMPRAAAPVHPGRGAWAGGERMAIILPQLLDAGALTVAKIMPGKSLHLPVGLVLGSPVRE